MKELILSSEQVGAWCEAWVPSWSDRQIILLQGPLGVGKTFWVQAVIQALGGSGVSSPSFSVIQSYKVQKRQNVYHVDLYRLQGDDDLESTGFWDLFDLSLIHI